MATSGIIDISMPLAPDMPTWPTGPKLEITRNREWGPGVDSVSSRIDTNAHNGTHIDAPAHFLADGETIDDVDLSACVGRCHVVDVGTAKNIDADVLASSVPPGAKRLLLRTSNSDRWVDGERDFFEDFVALTVDGAQWLVDNDVLLVANDYLSIQLYKGDPETHRILLRSGVVVVEGVLLGHVDPGEYELLCLPLLVAGAEAAPARAVLRRI